MIIENVLAGCCAFPNRWQQSHNVDTFGEQDRNMKPFLKLSICLHRNKNTAHISICNNISILFNIEMISLRSAVLQTVNTSQ